MKSWEWWLSVLFLVLVGGIYLRPLGAQTNCDLKEKELRALLRESRQALEEQSTLLSYTEKKAQRQEQELSDLKKNSKLLNEELKVSKQESAQLKADLVRSEARSEQLFNETEKLQILSEGLRKSLDQERIEADQRIQKAEAEATFWKILAPTMAGAGLALGIGAMYLLR